MPTNNPQTHVSSAGKSGSEFSSNLERNAERIERGAGQLASDAIERVRSARDQGLSGITEQRDMVADRIRRLGDVLRDSSARLGEDDPLAEGILRMTSDRFEGLADYVSSATPSTLADDLSSLARRRPGVFFGGAFLLGLAVGRFVRSSTQATEARDDLDYERFERDYPGRPAETLRDDAAPGAGIGASSTAYASVGTRPASTVTAPPATSTAAPPTTSPYASRPAPASGGTLPPPAFGGAAASPLPSTPGSSSKTGVASTGGTLETERGQGAKS